MKELQLGVGRAIITPKVGCNLMGYRSDLYSESVADDLTATAFWFCQEEIQALMVSMTICNLNNFVRDILFEHIEEQFGISRDAVMLSCTHTHSGPQTGGIVVKDSWGSLDKSYIEGIFVPRVLEAITIAKDAVRSVTVGVADGESFIGVNRRQLTKDNKVVLGQSPWGSFDPKMTVLSFRDETGKTYANMIHYGLHGTCAGQNTAISRDWSGIMIDRMELITGGITAFFNGTAGDTGPRLSNGFTTGKSDFQYVHELGNVAAQDAVGIWKKIASYRKVRLQTAECTVSIPVKHRVSYEDAQKGLVTVIEGFESENNARRRYYQSVLDSYSTDYIDMEVHQIREVIVRIGDVAFYGIPFEPFSGIGLRVRAYSDVPYPLCVGYTNGSESYFVTQDQIALGGYEVNMFRYRRVQQYVDNADWYLIAATVDNLKQVAEEGDANR